MSFLEKIEGTISNFNKEPEYEVGRMLNIDLGLKKDAIIMIVSVKNRLTKEAKYDLEIIKTNSPTDYPVGSINSLEESLLQKIVIK